MNDGYPLHVCELLATLEAPVYIERVGLGDNKQIAQAARAIKRAVENQVRGLGFSLIEVLSPCPTIWKMTPVEAQRWVGRRWRRPSRWASSATAHSRRSLGRRPGPLLRLRICRGFWRLTGEGRPARGRPRLRLQRRRMWTCGCAWLGLGDREFCCWARCWPRLDSNAGLEVSWLPSYGPEMRSGTSNCQVRIASEAIDSPLVNAPNVSDRDERAFAAEV